MSAKQQSISYLTKREAAELLRCSQSTISGYMAAGKIKARKFGAKVLFVREELIRLVEQTAGNDTTGS